MCSILGGRPSSAQTIATTSKRLRCSSRLCRRKKCSAASVSRRCFSGVTASAGTPRRRVLTSAKTRTSALARHQVDFTPGRVITARDDAQPTTAQISRRRALATVAEQPGPEPIDNRSHERDLAVDFQFTPRSLSISRASELQAPDLRSLLKNGLGLLESESTPMILDVSDSTALGLVTSSASDARPRSSSPGRSRDRKRLAARHSRHRLRRGKARGTLIDASSRSYLIVRVGPSRWRPG